MLLCRCLLQRGAPRKENNFIRKQDPDFLIVVCWRIAIILSHLRVIQDFLNPLFTCVTHSRRQMTSSGKQRHQSIFRSQSPVSVRYLSILFSSINHSKFTCIFFDRWLLHNVDLVARKRLWAEVMSSVNRATLVCYSCFIDICRLSILKRFCR